MVLQNINNFWKWTKKKYEIAMGFSVNSLVSDFILSNRMLLLKVTIYE
jgi:hypothetical protein